MQIEEYIVTAEKAESEAAETFAQAVTDTT